MIRRNQKFLTQLYMVADFLVIQLSFLAAWWIKFKSGWMESYNTLPVESYAYWSMIYGVVAVLIGILLSLYLPKRKKRFVDEFIKIFQVHIMSIFILLGLMFFVKEIDISRTYLAIYMGFNV
ncbi:undecaprenyl-phosphate glucose phosphotransferase, partial [Paenibacillus odorifer]